MSNPPPPGYAAPSASPATSGVTVAALMTRLRVHEPTSPRLTWYSDDLSERVELSGRVVDNWTAKAANLLADEWDFEPGGALELRLPAGHWRACYWALATWALGGTVRLPRASTPADQRRWSDGFGAVAVQPRRGAAMTGPSGVPAGFGSADLERVLVRLAALPPRGPVPLPPQLPHDLPGCPWWQDEENWVPEWVELPPCSDVFTGFVSTAAGDLATTLTADDEDWTALTWFTAGTGSAEHDLPSDHAQRVFLDTRRPPGDLLSEVVRVLARDGSVVLAPGDHPNLTATLKAEGLVEI